MYHTIAQPTSKDSLYLPRRLKRFTYHRPPPIEGSIYSHLKLVDWTPGLFCLLDLWGIFVVYGLFSESRTYNISVYDAAGLELCSMVGLQLKEVSGTSPAKINIRYDIVLQPIIASWLMPRLPAADFTSREVQDRVYNYLDCVAQEVIRDSLAKEPVIGEEVLWDHT